MVNCDVVDKENGFLDSLNQDLVHPNEDSTIHHGVFGVEFWRRNELRSVKERRESFIREMGWQEELGTSFAEWTTNFHSSEMGLDSLEERSGSVSTSSSCSSFDIESISSGIEFHGRDQCNGNANSILGHGVAHNVRRSVNKRQLGHWWREIINKRRNHICKVGSNGEVRKNLEMDRIKTRVHKKKVKELSALFTSQQIQAHKGVIRVMKFSPNGKYLACGGQDGVVKVWRIKSIDSYLRSLRSESRFTYEKREKTRVVTPDKMFEIDEQPLHEFHDHVGDVLDLAWSSSDLLLSASMDKTVRLWQMGSNECCNIFLHTNNVTCIEFNPMDDHSFISGSIDGKVRIWGLSNGRVLSWADVGDAISAICYEPDGQGIWVATLGGGLRYYEAKGDLLELSAAILIHNNKRSSTKRITNIKFSPKNSKKTVTICEDSKAHIFNKMDVIRKYQGCSKSDCQMYTTFASNGRHIISIRENSHIYVWNEEQYSIVSSSNPKISIHSCEYFKVEGVSIALPWYGCTETRLKNRSSYKNERRDTCKKRSHSISFFSNLLSSQSSTTWPDRRRSFQSLTNC